MKKFVFALIFLTLILKVYSQNGRFLWDFYNIHESYYVEDIQFKGYYDLIGLVKEVVLDEETLFNTKHDSAFYSYNLKEKLVFNELGYLLKKYHIKKDNSFFLSEENEYDKRMNLINKKEYSKKIGWENETRVETGVILLYEEKFTYTDKNKLLTKYIKSSYQNNFFISKRNVYDSLGQLVKKIDFNNHISTSILNYSLCEGNGSNRDDYIYLYKYNVQGDLINEKVYYDNTNRTQANSFIREDGIDYLSSFELKREEIYEYDSNKNMIYKKNVIQKGKYNAELQIEERFLKYDINNMLISKIHKNQNGNTFGAWYEYQYDKEFLYRIIKGYIKTNHTPKSISKIIKFNRDKSFTEFYYTRNELEEIEIYNSEGNLVQVKNKKNRIKSEIFYEYDTKGNWIEKIIIKGENNIEIIKRAISYY